MRFPESPRVLYEKNPLSSVISQLRFPPILRIDSELPAKFQESIRREYPNFSQKQLPDTKLSLPAELSRILGEELSLGIHGGKQAYDFSSGDGVWQISLTRDFIALTTKNYIQWQDFRNRFTDILDVFEAEYAPAHYLRAGLRYQDLVKRTKLNLKDVPWSELLQPHIAGELNVAGIENAINAVKREVLISLSNGQGQVRIKHGLVKSSDDGETCYLIDSDFFSDEKTEVANAPERLDHFNREAGRLFRWCITDRLHTAMGPQPIPNQHV